MTLYKGAMKMYFKSDYHEEQTNLLLEKFGKTDVLQDIEYGSLLKRSQKQLMKITPLTLMNYTKS